MLKYKIKDKLDSIKQTDPKLYNKTMKGIIDGLGLHTSAIYRMVKYEQGSKSAINTDQLKVIAKHLGCKSNDLLN